jgi:hypothetical protein
VTIRRKVGPPAQRCICVISQKIDLSSNQLIRGETFLAHPPTARLGEPGPLSDPGKRAEGLLFPERKYPAFVRLSVLVATLFGSWLIVFVFGISLLYIFRRLFAGG